MIYDYSKGSGISITVSADAGSAAPESFSVSAGQSDIKLKYTMPQAEYMYGCAATAIGMLLGYYDMYGYNIGGTRYSMNDLIAGTVSVNSRGSDGGSIYDMKDPSVLANFIASTGFVSRFYNTTPEQERPNTFVNGDPDQGLNISVWDCLADYLGTGQYWRSNEDLGTSHYNGTTLEDIINASYSGTVDTEGIPAQFIDFKYGLSLYVQSVGYALNVKDTKSVSVENFTFEDFCNEIDADRPVLVSMHSNSGGHMVVAYGYNRAKKEIIFDDTYHADCRMEWDGVFEYAGDKYSLSSFSLVVFDESSLTTRIMPEVLSVAADITKLTNQNVKVSATFNDETTIQQYSFDGKTWRYYEDYVEMSGNGTVYFRGLDELGNASKIVSYRVDNIDKLMPTVTADITAPTNKGVTVSAAFDAGVKIKQYSTDGKIWNTYSRAIKVDRNQTLYFRGLDEDGNVSTVVRYDVTNIDKTAPDAPTIKASTTELTNKNVTLTATFSATSEKKQYSFDNKTWKDYTTALSVDKNCGLYFRAADAVGNVSKVVSYLVTNIDKSAPDAPTVKLSTTKPTNKDVTVTASFTKDSAQKQYSTDNKKWNTYTKALTVAKNSTLYFRAADQLGNMSLVTVCKVANIDKTAPTVSVKASTTKATNKPVTLTATFSADSTKKQYSTDKKSWKNYTKAFSTDKNGTFYFRAADAAGNVSKITTVKVTNISKSAPTVTVKASTTKVTNKNVTLTATYSKDAVSSLYSFDNKKWSKYTKAITVSKNRTVYFKAVNAAGNVSKIKTVKVTNIDKTAPDAPKAVADVTSLTNKNVVVKATFSKDSAKKQYSLDNKIWSTYTKAVTMTANGTVRFRGIDAAGNISKVASVKVSNIDKTAPDAPKVKANTVNVATSVKLTATFSGDTVYGSCSTNNRDWQLCTGTLTVKKNGTYYFRGIDAAGNVSDVTSIKVSNIADTANNSWADATKLAGTVAGVLDTSVDKVDYYDVADVAKLMLDMESGKAKVTFCGSDKKAVSTQVVCADSSSRNLSSLTLAADDSANDNITLSDLGDAVKYLKVESTSGPAAYKLAKLA